MAIDRKYPKDAAELTAEQQGTLRLRSSFLQKKPTFDPLDWFPYHFINIHDIYKTKEVIIHYNKVKNRRREKKPKSCFIINNVEGILTFFQMALYQGTFSCC